ncbi:MAG: glycoside hydrolase family 127 protein [Chloroflexota bacterium]|nr:glycoside hydrolase family 127 protein [Chloroflexota bacterium]
MDAVSLGSGLWTQKQAIIGDDSLRHGYRMLERAGNLHDLRLAAGQAQGEYRGPLYQDSDVYKWLEAVAYQSLRGLTPEVQAMADEAIELIVAAQREDGYLNSYYQIVEPSLRWKQLAVGHELYCAGHLLQAAIAFRRVLGDSRLFEVACRFADHIDATFGPDKQPGTCGHPEIEMALVELYRETAERRYLALAQFFVDQRGHGILGPSRLGGSAYYQDSVPVRESLEVEGHAVRALYLTAGIADIFLETGEQALLGALQRQWQDMVGRKLYVTGGIGARFSGEAFGQAYELPNDRAYCETCAAIASIMWSWRMLLATSDGRFADLIERTLYNAFLSGVSLDGRQFFYVNPLLSRGEPEHVGRGGPRRQDWHSTACCPPNVMRLVASIGHYLATTDSRGLQIHQYAPSSIVAELTPDRVAGVRVETAYPWDGQVRIVVDASDVRPWRLSLRTPAWCDDAALRVNGESIDLSQARDGYVTVDRVWQRGDRVELDLGMTPRFVEGHPWIETTRGSVALERGPLVYCLEQADHAELNIMDVEVDATQPLDSVQRPDLLGGVVAVQAHGYQVDHRGWSNTLYRPRGKHPPAERSAVSLTGIPYYVWANRAPGAMRVWLPAANG